MQTFETSGKADISFNRLHHYQQATNQNVRQYYFDIMKLCKEANPLMDNASKLEYLKDGLKSSLRFDVLLKNPEEFLQYAQKIEQLKSLNDKQDTLTCPDQQKYTTPPTINLNNKSQPINQPFKVRSPNHNDVDHKTN